MFVFVYNNRNSCGKFTDFFVMQAIDHEQKI